MYLNRGRAIWPAPITHTEKFEGTLWTHNCLRDSQSDNMQRLQGCLCWTFQSHPLTKKFVIDMTNIYSTNIKLCAAANQAIYLVIFHWVVGSLYLNWYINFTTKLM